MVCRWAAICRAANDHILDVHQALDLKLESDARGVVHDGVNFGFGEGQAGVYRHGIAAVNAGALHMLHDAGYEHILAVAHGVHLDLAALEILVDEHAPAHTHFECVGHVAHELGGVLHNLHRPAAKHVAGTHEHGVAYALRDIERLFEVADGCAGWVGYARSRKELLEQVAVGCDVDGARGRAEYGHPHAVKSLRQVDSRLAAELHDGGRELQLGTVSGE